MSRPGARDPEYVLGAVADAVTGVKAADRVKQQAATIGTAIHAGIEWSLRTQLGKDAGRFALETYVVMLAPMAPHIAEELWRALGHTTLVHLEPWPKFSADLARDEMVTVVVQVNGKVRDRLQVGAGTPEEEVRGMALRSEAVARHLDGKQPKKIIYVPDKLVSIVA